MSEVHERGFNGGRETNTEEDGTMAVDDAVTLFLAMDIMLV